VYKKTASGRYRIIRSMPKPTFPVRIEGVEGVDKSLFKHAILLPDGHIIPWVGKPRMEFVEFWKLKVRQWDELIAERKQQEWFCCPRCDGFLKMHPHPRPAHLEPRLPGTIADTYFCPNQSCSIERAQIRRRQSISRVQVVEGIVSDAEWRRALRRGIAAIRLPEPFRGDAESVGLRSLTLMVCSDFDV